MRFVNSTEAFETLYDKINAQPLSPNGTRRLLNVGFYLDHPFDNSIATIWRKWKLEYAEKEWSWYLSGDRSAATIGIEAKRWNEIADEHGNVNSNYGAIWQEDDMLEKVIDEFKRDRNTRRASLSLFDARRLDTYGEDTVCTYAINFKLVDDLLEMSVLMRSNDLWFGFCNDQYCFSNLQQLVAERIGFKVGRYYHFAQDLHLYAGQFDRKIT